MISRACYVQCDRCGDPAPVSVEGAKIARAHARQVGYVYTASKEDVCSRCIAKMADEAEDGYDVDEILRRRND